MNRGQNINDTVVSTIIPSYNKHHFLKEALFSVLQQSHTNQEVIIVNDYPTLEAREEVEALKKLDDRVHVIHNKTNIGIAPSRNKAIAYSSGKYIAMLDHDDVWHDPDKIKKQLNALKKDTNISVIGTRYYDVDRNLRIIKGRQFPLDDATIRQKLNLAMPGLQSSFVFPAKAMEKIGGFNERISMTDDYEILFRALKVGTMKNLPEYTTLYRAHENTSRDKKMLQ